MEVMKEIYFIYVIIVSDFTIKSDRLSDLALRSETFAKHINLGRFTAFQWLLTSESDLSEECLVTMKNILEERMSQSFKITYSNRVTNLFDKDVCPADPVNDLVIVPEWRETNINIEDKSQLVDKVWLFFIRNKHELNELIQQLDPSLQFNSRVFIANEADEETDWELWEIYKISDSEKVISAAIGYIGHNKMQFDSSR